MKVQIIVGGGTNLIAKDIAKLLAERGTIIDSEDLIIINEEDYINNPSNLYLNNDMLNEYIQMDEISMMDIEKEKTNYFEREKSLRFLKKARRR